MNHPLPSVIYSGGALVQSTEAPAAPVDLLRGPQYKTVEDVASSCPHFVGPYECEAGHWNGKEQ